MDVCPFRRSRVFATLRHSCGKDERQRSGKIVGVQPGPRKPVFIGRQLAPPHPILSFQRLDFGPRLAILKRKRMPNNRIWCAALMGLFFMAVIARPVCAQATDSWHYIKVLSGPGNVNGAIAGIDHSWVQLKFKWSSPCPSPRSLIITARGNNIDLASKQFGDLWPVGEVAFPLPPASDTVTLVMANGPCEAKSEVQVFATRNASAQIAVPAPDKPGGSAPTLTKTQIKEEAKLLKAEKKAEEKRRAAEELQRNIDYCVRLSRKPMSQVTPAELDSIARCRYLGFL